MFFGYKDTSNVIAKVTDNVTYNLSYKIAKRMECLRNMQRRKAGENGKDGGAKNVLWFFGFGGVGENHRKIAFFLMPSYFAPKFIGSDVFISL